MAQDRILHVEDFYEGSAMDESTIPYTILKDCKDLDTRGKRTDVIMSSRFVWERTSEHVM